MNEQQNEDVAEVIKAAERLAERVGASARDWINDARDRLARMVAPKNPLTNEQKRTIAAVLGLDERRVSEVEASGLGDGKRVCVIEYTAAVISSVDMTPEQREAVNAIVYPSERE